MLNRFGLGGAPAHLAPPTSARYRPPAPILSVPDGTVWDSVEPVDIQPGDVIRYHDYRPEIARVIIVEVSSIALVRPAPTGVDRPVIWLTYGNGGYAGLSSDVAVEKAVIA